MIDLDAIGIINKHFGAVLGSLHLVFRIVAPHIDEEDLLQEAQCAVLLALNKGHYSPDKGDLEPWALTVAKNALRDLLERVTTATRSSRVDGFPVRTFSLTDGDEVPDLRNPETDYIAEELADLAVRFVDTVLDALKARHREVFANHIRPPTELGSDPTLANVADHLGVKIGVVKYSLGKAQEQAIAVARRKEFRDLNQRRDHAGSQSRSATSVLR